MSTAWSTTNCFSRRFSSSIALSHVASSDFVPSCCARQRANVASMISRPWSSAARSFSEFSIASASRSFATSCSGLCCFRHFADTENLLPDGL
jgi:hypothetical protein